MTREIKFRAWDGKQKIMPYSDNFIDPSPIVKLNAFFHWIHELKDIKLMQYTGLKDSKNTEVYEGDIVRLKYANIKELFIGEVKWCLTGWDILSENVGWLGERYLRDSRCEVIGNIYESKSPLKEE